MTDRAAKDNDLLRERIAVAQCDGQCDGEWASFAGQVKAGDEVWRYSSPDWTWRNLCGRAGIALVRAGIIVASRLTMMS